MPSYPTSSFRSLIEGRCPRCHQGPLFSAPVTNLARFSEMPAECPACSQTYEPEPGFYYGAMFISYAFSVATLVITGLATYVLGHDPAAWVYVTNTILGTLVMAPFSYRASRALMLYLFGSVHFDARVAGQVAAGTWQRPAPKESRRAPRLVGA